MGHRGIDEGFAIGHDAVLRVQPSAFAANDSLLVRVTGPGAPAPGTDVLLTVRAPVMAWPAPTEPAGAPDEEGLTPAGEGALPEAPVMDLLETSLQTAFGPGHRGTSFPHFKEDPSGLLTLLMDRMAAGDRPSTFVSEYEDLLEAFDRTPPFADLQPPRAKIGFLVRLLRACREDPKRAYLWCNRERLNAVTHRLRSVLPATVAASGWRLPYAADLFLVDGGRSGLTFGDPPAFLLSTPLDAAPDQCSSGCVDLRVTVEDSFVAGDDRLVQQWRYDWADGHIRGIDVFVVRDGLVAEKLAYVKG